MIKNERQNEIIKILRDENYATVLDLSKRLFASAPTIRRDLSELESEGYVRRSHGGVTLNDDKLHHHPVGFRRGSKMREKMAICKLAAELVSTGELVFIDDSTTAYHLADFLVGVDNVTVVTNGLSICQRLFYNNIKTISTGGRINRDSEAFVGYFAEQTVLSFNADYMFFSAAALDDEGIISDYSEEETSLRRIMKSRSRRTVFLCDSEKFGATSELRSFSLTEIDYVVTDEPLLPDLLEKCSLIEKKRTEGAILYSHKEN